MASGKAKYDPLEAAKLGTDQSTAPAQPAFETPKASAAPKAAPPPPDPDQEQRRPRYKLLEDKRVSVRGMLCDWKAGRVIDSAGFDIETLKLQGCKLELIKE